MRTSFSKPPLSVAHEAAYTVRPQYAGRYGTNGVVAGVVAGTPGMVAGVVAGTPGMVAGVVAGTPGMDADLVGRDRVEDAHPTDLDGEAGGELTHLLNCAKDGEARF